MRIDRVKYTAHYDEYGQLKAQWIGMEAAIDDTEDAGRQLTAIKELTESWYKSNAPSSVGPVGVAPYDGNSFPGPRVIDRSENIPVGLTPQLLQSCTDLTTLQSFFLLVKSSNDADLNDAYEKRKSELVNEESKELLAATEAHTKLKKSK